MGAIANAIAASLPRLQVRTAPPSSSSPITCAARCASPPSPARRTLFVMTHDSIGVGEDGPTHQPIEHLASFRAMPGMLMMRPADGNETAGAYKIGVEQTDRPTTLALSRQVVPNLPGTSKEGVAMGAYVVQGPAAGEDCDCDPHRYRHRARAGVQGGRGARGQGARRVHAVLGALRGANPTSTRRASSPRTARRSSPSRLAPRSAGPSTRTSPSAAMTSARPRRRASSTRSSASPRKRWWPPRSLSCKFLQRSVSRTALQFFNTVALRG